jgi:hypothetical protein
MGRRVMIVTWLVTESYLLSRYTNIDQHGRMVAWPAIIWLNWQNADGPVRFTEQFSRRMAWPWGRVHTTIIDT